jgi:hypothetical protein
MRSEMTPTDLRPRPPDNATFVAAILGTDLYSFVQASFPIVSGGGGFLPNWHIEAICHETVDHHRAASQPQIHLRLRLPASLYSRPRSRSPDYLRQLFRRTCAQARQ